MASQVPLNEKLWASVVFQAKTKYAKYPSPGASHWVHQRYIELGGRFENVDEHTRRKKILKQMWERKLKEKAARGDHNPRNKKEEKKDKKD